VLVGGGGGALLLRLAQVEHPATAGAWHGGAPGRGRLLQQTRHGNLQQQSALQARIGGRAEARGAGCSAAELFQFPSTGGRLSGHARLQSTSWERPSSRAGCRRNVAGLAPGRRAGTRAGGFGERRQLGHAGPWTAALGLRSRSWAACRQGTPGGFSPALAGQGAATGCQAGAATELQVYDSISSR